MLGHVRLRQGLLLFLLFFCLGFVYFLFFSVPKVTSTPHGRESPIPGYSFWQLPTVVIDKRPFVQFLSETAILPDALSSEFSAGDVNVPSFSQRFVAFPARAPAAEDSASYSSMLSSHHHRPNFPFAAPHTGGRPGTAAESQPPLGHSHLSRRFVQSLTYLANCGSDLVGTDGEYPVIPVEYHMVALNITRSTKANLSDLLIVVSALHPVLDGLTQQLQSALASKYNRGVSVLVLPDNPSTPQEKDYLCAADWSSCHPAPGTITTPHVVVEDSPGLFLVGDSDFGGASTALMASPSFSAVHPQPCSPFAPDAIRIATIPASALPQFKNSSFPSTQRRLVTIKTHVLYAALVELADIYISVEGAFLREAMSMGTPSILLMSDDAATTFLQEQVAVPPRDSTSSSSSHCEFSSVTKNARGISTKQLVSIIFFSLQRTVFNSTATPHLTFHGYLDPTMGYGISAIQMALELSKKVSVAFFPFRSPKPAPNWEVQAPAGLSRLVAHSPLSERYIGKFVPHEAEVRAKHRLARKAKISIVYTTFETTKVPALWVHHINHYDILFVSCPRIRDAFRSGGVTIPIYVVPLGVVESDWPVLSRTLPPNDVFRFLLFADGDWANHRKNYRLVYDSFLSAFPHHRKDVELLLKLTHWDDSLRLIDESKPANVQIVVGKLTQQKLLLMMRDAHVLVFPSRGEGFGLPPREAMSTGMPVILAGFAGLENIAREDIAFPIDDWQYVDALGYDVWRTENCDSNDFGQWANINQTSLVRLMQFAQAHPDEVAKRGAAAAAYIRSTETYPHTAANILRILESVYSEDAAL